MALLDATGPRDVRLNGLLLFGCEEAGVALIAQRNREITSNKLTVAVLHLAWVSYDTLHALLLEVIRKQHELAVAGHLAPIEDGNAWRFAATGPVLVGIHQGMQDAVACWQWAHLKVMQKLAHHGQ